MMTMMTMTNNSSGSGSNEENSCSLEKDYYGCYCLKFIVKNGTHITEEKVIEDFGAYGDVVDVRGPGLFSGLRGNHVYVRFIERRVAEQALNELSGKYHQLTPASISDVLPDNYGLYTISFYNKTGIPSSEVRREFSKFGEVKNLTGSLDVKGGRVFVSYKNKESAVQALQAFFFRKDRYPNMKFALPRCEKDYFGCFCLKFYNKTGEMTYEKVLEDFNQYGEVVDVRGPGLFDVTGDDVYVRYKVQSSAEQALIELVGKYDSLCLAPPSDIQADKFGYYTITFVNDKCLSKSDVWYIFSKFGTVACVNGTFDCKKGRVFVSYKEKQGALNALETMLITKEYHLQVSKNSTVRKNDYNVVPGSKENESMDFSADMHRQERASSEQKSLRDRSCSREASCGPPGLRHAGPPPMSQQRPSHLPPPPMDGPPDNMSGPPPPLMQPRITAPPLGVAPGKNGLVKFNRNVEMDIFGYYCLSFLNEDGEISEKKVRTDFSKFGEVVSVRGALGKQKGHVFVRFRKKEAAENCLNCLNSFPLNEMSELFGRYLFLSPATPRDIDCDMYGFFSISFLNLNAKPFSSIRSEFGKFGEIVRLISGGGGNTDELVTISYAEKSAAVQALKTHFTNKDYPYLDIAKGSSLLLVNSSDSSDCEDHESTTLHHHHQELARLHQDQLTVGRPASRTHSSERTHDPFSNNSVAGSDVVDELLKPLQSYFSVFRTGSYDHGTHGLLDEHPVNGRDGPPAHNTRSHDKRYKVKKNQPTDSRKRHEIVENGIGMHHNHGMHHHPPQQGLHPQQVQPMQGQPMHPSQGMQGPPQGMQVPPQGLSGPPPVTNGYNPNAARIENIETEISQLPPPNMNEPPPSLVGNPPYPPPRPMLLLNPMVGPPPSVMMSPPGNTPLFSTPTKEAQCRAELRQEQLENDIGNLSIREQENLQMSTDVSPEMDRTTQIPADSVPEQAEPVTSLTKDMFSLYSLSFISKSKDLSERRIKLDFGLVAEVARVRGQFGRHESPVIVSFDKEEEALACLHNKTIAAKYPSLTVAPAVAVVPDKEGYFSIEFVNTGMSGVKEITNDFSRHGELVKVHQGGAKNAVKRVTVSYTDMESAMRAITAYANDKDVRGIDFVAECLEFQEKPFIFNDTGEK